MKVGVLWGLFPTWLFGWFVMGVESDAVSYAILAATVLGNVAVFVGVGLVSQRFTKLSRSLRWAATVGVYVVAYAVVTFVAYQFL